MFDVGRCEDPVALEGGLSYRDVLVGVTAVGQGVAGGPGAARLEACVGLWSEPLVPRHFGGGGWRVCLVFVRPVCVELGQYAVLTVDECED